MAAPDVLSIWTIYANPADLPGWFVARRFEITPAGPVPTSDTIFGPNLDPIRGYMEMRGLTVLPREEGNELQIVEHWI